MQENFMKHEKLIVIVALLVGSYLRLTNLGVLPFWCDEAFFATYVINWHVNQEYLPSLIAHILGVGNEFVTRLPFAICGILTIPAIYFVKPNKWSVFASLFVAVFPLFVMYDRMCRPYSMAALFIVLSWRWWWMMIPALFCTPLAIIGMRPKGKIYIAAVTVVALGMFWIRSDLSRPGFFTWDMFIHSPRLWYIPIIATILYLQYYILHYLWMRMNHLFGQYCAVMLVFSFGCLVQSVAIPDFKPGPPINPWYSNILFYNDWRGMPPVDLSTNFTQISEYYTGKPSVLLRRTNELTADRVAITDEPKIDNILRTKDTIYVGIDSYANNLSAWFFPKEFIGPYRERLYDGEVMLARICREPQTGRRFIQMVSKTTMQPL